MPPPYEETTRTAGGAYVVEIPPKSETPPPAYYECLGSPLPPLYPDGDSSASQAAAAAAGHPQNITVVAEAAGVTNDREASEVIRDGNAAETLASEVPEVATASATTAQEETVAEVPKNCTEVKEESKNEGERSK